MVSTLHGRTPQKAALAQFFSDKCSLYHLPSRFLFYYRRESVRNYYERHSVLVLKNVSQKSVYCLEIVTGLKLQLSVCVLCWGGGVVFSTKWSFLQALPLLEENKA